MQRIDVYSPTLERIGAIYDWISLVWTDCYNEGGSCQLEVVPSKTLRVLLAPDNLFRYSETGTMMVVESVQIEAASMIINGGEAAHILDSRVTTETIKAGTAETAVRAAVTKYAAGWDIINPGESAGLIETFETAQGPETLEEAVQAICQEADIGYRLVLNADRQLQLDCYSPGENTNAIYSPKFRNIGDIVYTESYKDWKNVCVVLSGSDDEGYTVKATVGDTDKTGHERREMVITGSDDSTSYAEQGRQALAEQADILTVDCSIVGGASLGEIITIRLPEIGVTVKKRITQIQITAQSGSVETIYTVGTIIKGVSN